MGDVRIVELREGLLSVAVGSAFAVVDRALATSVQPSGGGPALLSDVLEAVGVMQAEVAERYGEVAP